MSFINKKREKATPIKYDNPRFKFTRDKKIPRCYICNSRFTKSHEFYKTMCIVCGFINFAKRTTKVDMTGKIALVTGGRVKIGYYCALSLLRNGADVIVTTRFAKDAGRRYSEEKDYDEWKDRLSIIQLSLMHIESTIKLCNYIRGKYKKIDILIHNAAQTLRRPKSFFDNVNIQGDIYMDCIDYVIDDYMEYNEIDEKTDIMVEQGDIMSYKKMIEEGTKEEYTEHKLSIVPITPMPKIVVDEKDIVVYNETYFPKGKVDEHGQQIDLRPINTWTRKLDQVNIIELMEVLTVNTIAPFLITQQLAGLMKRDDGGDDTYIINVSSMEGCFNRRHKSADHPHTNMAKAGLNMMTRTCADDLKQYNIIMVSVDTGWNTIEQPDSYDVKSPIDCVDGAARILDPIYRKLKKHGVFYKDFEVIDW